MEATDLDRGGERDGFGRPQSLDAFVGQQPLKQTLQVALYSARNRSAPLDHTLVYGPPGLGKTTLARIVANELGANFKSISAPTVDKAADLVGPLLTLEARDVLFIDEIHRLPSQAEEVLYTAMEDFRIDCVIGEGGDSYTHSFDISPFTLIGATTRDGMLNWPLIERFEIQLKLDLYSTESLKQVLRDAAAMIDLHVVDAGLERIARRARGTPRIARSLLKRVRDYAIWHDLREVGEEDAEQALWQQGIDVDGLDVRDRAYLDLLNRRYRGGPVGVEVLASGLNEDPETLKNVVEPYLMQLGYLERTPRGRVGHDESRQVTGRLIE